MKALLIDTTKKQANIVVIDNNDYKVIKMSDKVKHSEGLFLYLEKALLESCLNIQDFDYLSAIVGPGSFTGIRVGMSVILGLNRVINKKIIPLNLFEVVSDEIGNGVMLLGSTMTGAYYGVIKSGKISEMGTIDKSQIKDRFEGDKIFILQEELDLFDGCDYNTINNLDSLYSKALIRKINSDDVGNFEPLYLQLSQAERNLNEKN